MKRIKLSTLPVLIIIILGCLGCGSKEHKITGTKGEVKEIVDGNTIKLNTGLKVRLLGVASNHDVTKVFMENNNIVGKKVKLITDSNEKKKTYKKNSATVKAYVFLEPDNICLNGLILRQCALADNTVYSEAYVSDSVDNWRGLFKTCNHEGNLPDNALYMKQRTFLIATPEGMGTGFFINENGLALTNYHVLPKKFEEQARIYMYADNPDDSKLYTQKERNVKKVLSYSPDTETDITIFSVDLLDGEKVPYFHLAKEQVPVGRHVQTFGNPGDRVSGAVYTAKYSQGAIGSYMTDEQHGRPDMQVVTYDIATNPGNSGGPVALDNGVVIAVHDMGERNSQGLSGGINILQVRKMLDAIGQDYDCK